MEEENMEEVTFKTLYKKNSSGKLQIWEIRVKGLNPPDSYRLEVTHGLLDGKKQVDATIIREGKNIGKANETTVRSQAVAEADAKWKKQRDRRNYVVDIKDVDEVKKIIPMLAHSSDKHFDKISDDFYIQPKLDGHRCIAVYENKKVTLYSRGGKEITGVPHINEELENAMGVVRREAVIFDGELYNHNFHDKFQELTGYIRAKEPKGKGHLNVEYHIYDLVDLIDTFEERLDNLKDLEKNIKRTLTPNYLKFVTTDYIEHKTLLDNELKKYLKWNYEGAIVRNPLGKYKQGRSYDLQKVKVKEDSEFKCINVVEGKGRMKGHGILVCVTSSGAEFKAKMKGDMSILKEMYEKPETVVDKLVTIEYRGLTDAGIPRHGVAIRVRQDI